MDFGERVSGDLHVLGDLEVEHARQHEVGAVVERVAKRFLGRDGAGRHHLEGDPRFLHRLHDLRDFFRTGAPRVVVVAENRVVVRLLRGRVIARVERLLIEVDVELRLFALDDTLRHVGGNADRQARAPHAVHRSLHQVHVLLLHKAVGGDAPEIDGVRAGLGGAVNLLERIVRHGRGIHGHDPLHLCRRDPSGTASNALWSAWLDMDVERVDPVLLSQRRGSR